MAYLNLKRIKKALSKNLLVVVDGMRSWEEYTFLKEKLPHLRLIVLTLYAGKHIRYQRIQHRKERSRLFGEQRDIDELLGTNMGPTIAYCDFLIINNLSLEDFHNRLEEVYRQAYFS